MKCTSFLRFERNSVNNFIAVRKSLLKHAWCKISVWGWKHRFLASSRALQNTFFQPKCVKKIDQNLISHKWRRERAFQVILSHFILGSMKKRIFYILCNRKKTKKEKLDIKQIRLYFEPHNQNILRNKTEFKGINLSFYEEFKKSKICF